MTRLRRSVTPERCPSCDCRIPLESVGQDRWFCAGCARDCSAVRDAQGDWVIDTEPLRYRQRRAGNRFLKTG